ncbi:MAG: serine/threonine protein kinase [Planctomycetota bacterium]|jgi:tetratricopeptide (TPR) repeat protein/predicted Ser/Thr protein kinase|nr:serine/threonine protein kinase [Planctomycetota bacterium]
MNPAASVDCPLCSHQFQPGLLPGAIYCPSCGRRFNPNSQFEETIVIGGEAEPASESKWEASSSVRLESDHAVSDPDILGKRFGDYDLLEEIARGGMGVVYLASQRILKRVVALKVLRSGDNASLEERERLLREAKAAAGLSHPNIVTIHEFSIHKGQPYFTMDFIPGRPLDRVLDDGPLNTREAVNIIDAVARAVAYAHSRGIIHRDLKPANIIIDESMRPMITDFGLAVDLASQEHQERMTAAGSVMGTIPYIPPEQAAGKLEQIDARSDVYSMGAVLYEMLTGSPPFSGFTQFELLRRVINQDPVPPRRLNGKIHRDAETIVLKCLEKDPRRRYASAADFAADCQSFLKGEVIAARPATLGYRARRLIFRKPVMTALALSVVVLFLAAWVSINRSQNLAQEKKAAEEVLEVTLAKAEEMAREKEKTDQQVRREWRTEYNISFDYAFRWDLDSERSRRLSIPWLDPRRARLLVAPPRLALASGPSEEDPGVALPSSPSNLGFPFAFPHELRVTMRLETPAEGVGDLLILLDADSNYHPNVGTTIARFGSPAHPGATLYRGEAELRSEPAFFLKPDSLIELVLERSDRRIRLLADNQLILETEEPAAMLNPELGRMSLGVHNGSLAFFDLTVEILGMSRNLITNLIETADTMAARGRADLSLRLYTSVLLEPTDNEARLRAIRGFARSLWLGLPRRDRNPAGIVQACQDLDSQLFAMGRSFPGELDYLTGLALSLNPVPTRDRLQALERLERAATLAGSDPASEFGDLAQFETAFVYLRLGMIEPAAGIFRQLFSANIYSRLYSLYGQELGGGGHTALLLELVDSLLQSEAETIAEDVLSLADTFLAAAAAISPSSRECAQRFRRLARINQLRGDYPNALAYFDTAIGLASDWHRPYVDKALLLYQFDPDQATEVIRRAEAALPQSLDLALALAALYLNDVPPSYQDPIRAEVAATTALELSQGLNPAAFELQARAFWRQNRLAEAREAVKAALELEKTENRERLLADISREEAAQEAPAAANPETAP